MNIAPTLVRHSYRYRVPKQPRSATIPGRAGSWVAILHVHCVRRTLIIGTVLLILSGAEVVYPSNRARSLREGPRTKMMEVAVTIAGFSVSTSLGTHHTSHPGLEERS